jgi:hypothetical protein
LFGLNNRNLRITFDTNIRTRRYDLKLESGDYGEDLLGHGQWLMEVKAEKTIPIWLSNLLSEHRMFRTSFSKYGNEFGYAVLFTVCLCLLMFFLKAMKIGVHKASQKLLKVTIPENLGYEEAFDEIFKKFKIDYELKKVRTTELGSLYELVYAVTFDPNTNQKEFLDAVRCRNGNLDITLTMSPAVQEY